jgi:DNA-binding NtrC family response regulator
LHVPALRERPEDIRLLLDHFLGREALRLGAARKTFSKSALDFLLAYAWPGNVRELENFVKHILVITPQDTVTREDLSDHFASLTLNTHGTKANDGMPEPGERKEEEGKNGARPLGLFDGYSWEELERQYILYLLEKNKWRITSAAKEAGVNRSTFDSRMKRLNIRR